MAQHSQARSETLSGGEPVGHQESVLEEIANAITHGLGLVLSLIGLGVLIGLAIRGADPAAVVVVTVYGTTLILVYLSSTLYHAIRHHDLKRIFLACDHCAILLLIAGTYTPLVWLSLGPAYAALVLSGLWGLAFIGILVRLVWSHRFSQLALPLYLGMGWCGVLWARPVFEQMGSGQMALIVVGGLFYTAGVGFYVWRRLPYNHAVWHVFVMTGSLLHYLAIVDFALPVA